MRKTLKRLFHRPAIRMGSVDNSRIRTTPIRNAGFVSFIEQHGGIRRVNSDRYDAQIRRRRGVKILARLALLAFSAWVVIESAQALSLY